MAEELQVIKIVVEALNKVGIAYMLTGSLATNYYSIPRMTRDIDIVIELSSDDVERVYETFKENFYIDKDMMLDAIKHEGMFNIIHNESVIKVDFIIRKDSEYRKLEFKRRKPIEIQGTVMWIASAEDMIISKLLWAKDSYSEMQIKDVRNMLKCLQDIDKQYLNKWIHNLGLHQIYNEAVNE